MKAIIITIGDEILLGQILDTNSQYISRQLTRLGAEVADILSIADQREEIWQWVDYAMKQAELIIVTGGLGPTKDDVTKKVLAEYFDTRLVMNEDVLRWIGKLLENGGMRMNEGNRIVGGIRFRDDGHRVRGNSLCHRELPTMTSMQAMPVSAMKS